MLYDTNKNPPRGGWLGLSSNDLAEKAPGITTI